MLKSIQTQLVGINIVFTLGCEWRLLMVGTNTFSHILTSVLLHSGAIMAVAVLPSGNMIPEGTQKIEVDYVSSAVSRGNQTSTSNYKKKLNTSKGKGGLKSKPKRASIVKSKANDKDVVLVKKSPSKKRIVKSKKKSTPNKKPIKTQLAKKSAVDVKSASKPKAKALPKLIAANTRAVRELKPLSGESTLTKSALKDSGEGKNEISKNKGKAASSDLAFGVPTGTRSHLDLKQRPGNRPPVYPTLARRKSWQGTVYLFYMVSPQGQVGRVRLLRSSGFSILDEEALRAIARYRYFPGQAGPTTHKVAFSLAGPAQETPFQLRTKY